MRVCNQCFARNPGEPRYCDKCCCIIKSFPTEEDRKNADLISTLKEGLSLTVGDHTNDPEDYSRIVRVYLFDQEVAKVVLW